MTGTLRSRFWSKVDVREPDRCWTHCQRGHEFTASNTYRDPKGRRRCRSCIRNREWAQYHEKKVMI